MNLDSNRTSRLARRLFESDRKAVHYDVATKERLIFRNRSKALNKYRGKSNIFGSFTAIPKLGINPQTKYNTPVGVYSYPVDYILDQVSGDIFDVPFAGKMPYLHIFSVSNLDKALNFNRKDTKKINAFKVENPGDFKSEDYNEVKALVLRINDYVELTIDEILEESEEYEFSWDKWFNNLKKATGFEPHSNDIISRIIMDTGGIGQDTIYRIMVPREFPLEKVLKNLQDVMGRMERAKAVTFPYEDRIMELSEVQAMSRKGYIDFKANVVLEARQRVKCDQAFAWNCTRHLSEFNPSKWTGLMRRIGLIGAVDYDTATIFPGEPTQAVFFDPSSISVLEVISNVPTETYSSGKKFSTWAEDIEKHMESAVNSFRVYLRAFLNNGRDEDQRLMFVNLSWLQQHGREFFKYHFMFLKDVIDEIEREREKSPADQRVIDKVIQILQRFIERVKIR
jgi:hypothetical protein